MDIDPEVSQDAREGYPAPLEIAATNKTRQHRVLEEDTAANYSPHKFCVIETRAAIFSCEIGGSWMYNLCSHCRATGGRLVLGNSNAGV
jgi:hypothetical protein